MNQMPGALLLFAAATTLLPAAVMAASAGPVAPGKFIPTYAIKYGGSSGWPSLEDAARFDLIDAGAGAAPASTWQTLRRLNPHQLVVVYQMGPGEYNTASWDNLGQGWDWIAANHGIDSKDRWTALGARYHDYLQSHAYSGERLMVVGSPAWQQYWLDNVWTRYWSPSSLMATADGIFSDNTSYTMPWLGGWLRPGHPDEKDEPVDYMRDGVYQPDLWRAQLRSFLIRAVPWLERRNKRLVINFGDMGKNPEAWRDIDSMPHPVFAAMEEGAFVAPWGGNGSFVFLNEEEWLRQVNTMRSLKHVRALMNVHGPVASPAQDLAAMDARDASGNRAWDVLWYTIASFLQGYDDVRQNAYMNFTVWEYTRFYWLKEFDPAYLHLGRARGGSHRVEATGSHIYLREFDDGWVAVNPSTADARNIPVPRGQARVLDHDTFEHPNTRPLTARFDLPAHRGIILLKPGHLIGNGDNR